MECQLIQDHQIVDAIIAACRNAKAEIVILQYHFRAAKRPRIQMAAVLRAILDAATRGVKVTIVLNKAHRPRRPGPDHGQIHRMLKHGNIRVCYSSSERILHTKAMLIDCRAVLMGSHNFSQVSFSTSQNLSVLIVDPSFAEVFYTAIVPILAGAVDA
jgi:phosphatidylserine/phosphatidylglycerophosphate/cardiolipin synthase-like enzyme